MKKKQNQGLFTRYGKIIDDECVHNDYPRPQMRRNHWVNLNGEWNYAIHNATQVPSVSLGKIIVPFSPEALCSKAQFIPERNEVLWYWRTFDWIEDDRRVLLHFGAVDQCSEVYLNGALLGKHEGGYLPFSFDMTQYLKQGENQLCVKVVDDCDNELYAYGKQKVKHGGIWYTPQSGIWQSVWIEHVPISYIQRLKLTPHYDEASIEVEIFHNFIEEVVFQVTIYDQGKKLIERKSTSSRIVLQIDDFKSWTPSDPFLYDMEVVAGNDKLTSYFGMRKFHIGVDTKGIVRLMLNNEAIFHNGLLDQGYWSDGLYTPPSDQAMVDELMKIKELGFNTLRKHIKIEPLRWYYHCDRLGILVWQDFVNGGAPYNPLIIQVLPFMNIHLSDHTYNRFGRANELGRAIYRKDMRDTVNLLYNCVSLAVWVPFNEGWGQFDSVLISDELKKLDNTRSIDSSSGWHDQHAGEFDSKHVYYKPYKFKTDKYHRVHVLSEFGGYSCGIKGHMASDKLFGYKMFHDQKTLTEQYVKLYEDEIIPAIEKGLSASIYTQVSDVEEEINGLFTFDREVLKLDEVKVKAINQKLAI